MTKKAARRAAIVEFHAAVSDNSREVALPSKTATARCVDEFFPRTPSFDRDGLAEESEHLDDLSKPIAQVTTHVFASKGGPRISSTAITVCGDGPREDLPTRKAQAYNHAVPIMLDIAPFVVGSHPAARLWCASSDRRTRFLSEYDETSWRAVVSTLLR
jgi:hypothetical protein